MSDQDRFTGSLDLKGPIVVRWPLGETYLVGLRKALILIGTLALVLGILGLFDYDNTDAPGEHSGLRPLTDALTGCQYLETPHGVTPRLDKDGRVMCR